MSEPTDSPPLLEIVLQGLDAALAQIISLRTMVEALTKGDPQWSVAKCQHKDKQVVEAMGDTEPEWFCGCGASSND